MTRSPLATRSSTKRRAHQCDPLAAHRRLHRLVDIGEVQARRAVERRDAGELTPARPAAVRRARHRLVHREDRQRREMRRARATDVPWAASRRGLSAGVDSSVCSSRASVGTGAPGRSQRIARSTSSDSRSTMRSEASMRMSMPGCSLLEVRQARHQPQRRERGIGGHRHARRSAIAANLVDGAIDRQQRLSHGREQSLTGGGQFERAGPPLEQRATELAFERGDLAADRRLGQAEFRRRQRERQVARRGVKPAQRGQSRSGRRRRGWAGAAILAHYTCNLCMHSLRAFRLSSSTLEASNAVSILANECK